VFLDTVTAYANVLTFSAVLELNQNNVQVLTRQFEAARDRFQVGEVTRTDVAQAEGRLAGARADVIQSQATSRTPAPISSAWSARRRGGSRRCGCRRTCPRRGRRRWPGRGTPARGRRAVQRGGGARQHPLILGELLPDGLSAGLRRPQYELSTVGASSTPGSCC
jgi:hypothetical protein